jgi:hypothetical protein
MPSGKLSQTPMELKARHGVKADERSAHEYVAVRKIDQFDDAIHHRIAQRDEGIHKAQLQSADDDLGKEGGILDGIADDEIERRHSQEG